MKQICLAGYFQLNLKGFIYLQPPNIFIMKRIDFQPRHISTERKKSFMFSFRQTQRPFLFKPKVRRLHRRLKHEWHLPWTSLRARLSCNDCLYFAPLFSNNVVSRLFKVFRYEAIYKRLNFSYITFFIFFSSRNTLFLELSAKLSTWARWAGLTMAVLWRYWLAFRRDHVSRLWDWNMPQITLPLPLMRGKSVSKRLLCSCMRFALLYCRKKLPFLIYFCWSAINGDWLTVWRNFHFHTPASSQAYNKV